MMFSRFKKNEISRLHIGVKKWKFLNFNKEVNMQLKTEMLVSTHVTKSVRTEHFIPILRLIFKGQFWQSAFLKISHGKNSNLRL